MARRHHSMRELRATTTLKRIVLLGLVATAVMGVAFALRATWSVRMGWDMDTATDLLRVVAFFLGSLLGAGALMSAIEVRNNGERLRWHDSSSIEPPSEPTP